MSLPALAILSAANSVHTHRWVNSLSKYFKVTLISLASHKDMTNSINPEIEVIYLPAKGRLAYFTAHKDLLKILHGRPFDVYNAHYASGYGTILRSSKLKPAVLNFWGTDIFEFPHISPLHKWILRKNVKAADIIVSTSHVMAREVKKVFPELRQDIAVVPFGVHLDKFAYVDRQPSEEIRVGTCKILSPNYAIDDMIKAYAIARSKLLPLGKTLTLEIYGDGPSRPSLEELTQDLNIQSSVNFHGWIKHDKIPDALYDLDLFLLSSLSESFGVSAIEAMATGLPVVATMTPGFSEVIKDQETGVLVPVHDPEAMAQEIVRLITDKEKYQLLSRAGRKSVEEQYDWNKNVAQFANVLKLAQMRATLK